jgi:hypothetical protein
MRHAAGYRSGCCYIDVIDLSGNHIENFNILLNMAAATHSQNCWLVLLKMSVAGSTLLKPWGDRHKEMSSLVITSRSLQKKEGLACTSQAVKQQSGQ